MLKHICHAKGLGTAGYCTRDNIFHHLECPANGMGLKINVTEEGGGGRRRIMITQQELQLERDMLIVL